MAGIVVREEGLAEIPGYLEAMDQPTIDGFNTWCVSGLARRHGIKVALSGLGGDELFAGYGSFGRVPQYRRLHRALGPLRSVAGRALRAGNLGVRWERLAYFLTETRGDWWDAFHVQRGIFTPAEALALVRQLPELAPLVPDLRCDADFPDLSTATTDRDRVSLMELTGYLQNQLLRDSDVFSMARGLELRVPFVDSRLFDTLGAIPARERLREGKQLLIQAVPEIPSFVRDQPKRGFRFPFGEWMEEGFGALLDVSELDNRRETWYRRWALATLKMRFK